MPEETAFAPCCLSLDLEVDPVDKRILKIGALRPDTGQFLHFKGNFNLEAALGEVDRLAHGASFVVGHNVVRHDLNLLKALAPGLELLALPVVDTLALSPLAFPRNPYHHLVKDYRLLKLAVNDPLADAQRAIELLRDQREAFALEDSGVLRVYHHLLVPEDGSAGLDRFFAALTRSPRPGADEAASLLKRAIEGRVCQSRLARLLTDDIGDPSLRQAIAYVLAWVRVAGENSVMPPWVRVEYPDTSRMIRELRGTPCSEAACTWCRENHDTRVWLKRWFAYDDFRRDAHGQSLQDDIVSAAIAGRSLLGILPTGGGKSLCYQLPALMRYYQTGAMTIVISPLQALMKDQVDSLRRRGIIAAATLNGSLSLPERKQVLEGIRLGDVGILLVSPEQARNRSFRDAIRYREIAAWVFDEAHCLSKWGHDFRPDYLYVSRFIRERASDSASPVLCLTATAKQDVIDDIAAHFRQRLGVQLEFHLGAIDRRNLSFAIVPTRADAKHAQIHRLLADQFGEPPDRLADGGAIVYCATRAHTEHVARYLAEMGWPAAAYHAGLPPDSRKERQQDFIHGTLKVITATNAFGMGIDKPDVRLVIHADIPGSLENYIQEAGRAGRDQEAATCVLFYDDKDAEQQFGMTMKGRLTRRDIQNLLHALRRRPSDVEGNVVLTVGELLATEDLNLDFDPADRGRDTRVRTAVAWLEDAALLERNENRTQVFPASLQFKHLDEARKKLAESDYSETRRNQLLELLRTILNTDPKEGLSTDELGVTTGLGPADVGRALHDLETLGLLRNDSRIVAYLRVGVQNASLPALAALDQLESALLGLMRESAPDAASSSDAVHLNLPGLTQRLRDEGFAEVLPERVGKLLTTLRQDGREQPGGRGSLVLRETDRHNYRVRVQREWSELEALSRLRRNCAHRVLAAFLERIPAGVRGKDLQADLTLGDIAHVLKNDLTIAAELRDVPAAVQTALLYLHEHGVVTLAQGLSIFRTSMTLRLYPEERKRGFASADYQPLSDHYDRRVSQIHVMIRYAEMGLGKVAEALKLVGDYFTLDWESFLARYFPDQKELLERATTEASWRRITDGLSPIQKRIVTEKRPQNRLVLAGPGSGKTRLIVHRVGFLVRVLRERPESILVVTFNRHAAMEVRRRLRELIDRDAFGVAVHTYHGLAMRLTGVSLSNRDPEIPLEFDKILVDATRLLKGETAADWETPDTLRDRLLQGYRWLLVDEYQDINELQYEFLSALAGRTLQDRERKLNLLAVGDDDQNIYEFNGAQVEFIRRFEQDYGTKTDFLVENFRSTAHIISVANAFIERHPGRLKVQHPIAINAARRKEAAGGRWARRDAAVSQGRVQVLDSGDGSRIQGWTALHELRRLADLDPEWNWSNAAVIGREWKVLESVRAGCELLGIPCHYARHRESAFPVRRLREVTRLLQLLESRRGGLLSSADLRQLVDELRGDEADSPGNRIVLEFIDDLESTAGDAAVPVSVMLDAAYEFLAEANRRTGEGVCLTTAHGAKGLEFNHVVLLDGGWRTAGLEAHAERRLYYVAMTRARQTLALCRMAGRGFSDELTNAPGVLVRAPAPLDQLPPELSRRFEVLSLKDVDMDFAGREKDPAARRVLSELQFGDELVIDTLPGQERLAIRARSGQIVGRTAKHYRAPAGRIVSARVAAICVRNLKDAGSDWKMPVDVWEVVLPELVIEGE